MSFATRLYAAWLILAALGTLPAQRDPEEALRQLREGNERFAAGKSAAQPLGAGIRRSLARGQNPIAIVLCCADSRVPPEHVFNAGLGELFVVRVAGHTCDEETLASIEYAVEHLNVPLCVVLGHEGCGAVAATVAQVEGAGPRPSGKAASPALQQLLERIEPAVRHARTRELGGAALRCASEEENAHHTVHECLRRSGLLRRYASVGRFRIVPARYHLQSGEVEWLPPRPLPVEADGSAPAAPEAAPPLVPPHVALRMLQAGHRRFLGAGRAVGDVSAARREALTHGQHPLAIVVTCSDSRVAPEHVFDAGLGELFVVRIAGNTLNDDALASVEYAAAHTGASLLVVMGHTNCGAVKAASEHPEGHEMSANLRTLLARLEPPVAKARAEGAKGSDLVDLAVRNNVLRTVAEGRSRSPLLRQLEASGHFAMLPAVYDLASGDLTWLQEAPPATGPAAAPHAETRAAASGHGERDHGDTASGTPALDWTGDPAAPVRHAASAGAPHDALDDEDRGAHGDGHDTGQVPHATEPEPQGHEPELQEPATSPWLDPRIVLGIAGVVSLASAGMIALRRRA